MAWQTRKSNSRSGSCRTPKRRSNVSTGRTDVTARASSSKKRFCSTVAICKASMPETSCRRSLVKRSKPSSVCSVTGSASCFSNRLSSKMSAITSSLRTRISTRRRTSRCAEKAIRRCCGRTARSRSQRCFGSIVDGNRWRG